MLDAEEPNFLPRYYFHVKVGQMTVLDRDGLALPSLEDAKNEAIRRAQGQRAGKGDRYRAAAGLYAIVP